MHAASSAAVWGPPAAKKASRIPKLTMLYRTCTWHAHGMHMACMQVRKGEERRSEGLGASGMRGMARPADQPDMALGIPSSQCCTLPTLQDMIKQQHT
jgi:hypothetical protein